MSIESCKFQSSNLTSHVILIQFSFKQKKKREEKYKVILKWRSFLFFARASSSFPYQKLTPLNSSYSRLLLSCSSHAYLMWTSARFWVNAERIPRREAGRRRNWERYRLAAGAWVMSKDSGKCKMCFWWWHSAVSYWQLSCPHSEKGTNFGQHIGAACVGWMWEIEGKNWKQFLISSERALKPKTGV